MTNTKHITRNMYPSSPQCNRHCQPLSRDRGSVCSSTADSSVWQTVQADQHCHRASPRRWRNIVVWGCPAAGHVSTTSVNSTPHTSIAGFTSDAGYLKSDIWKKLSIQLPTNAGSSKNKEINDSITYTTLTLHVTYFKHKILHGTVFI